VHPHRVVHPRLISRLAVLVAILGVSAPESGARCLSDSCAQRLLRPAARCFDPEGPCVRDDGSGVTCWANGARSTTFSFLDRGAERSIYVGPGGRRCQIVTSVPDADGFQRTTHVRKGRRVVFVASAAGLRVTCPGGRVERYTAAELASPACPPGPPAVTCDAGHCD
jgi:hypothetical protein